MPITTERSFNAETLRFEANYPFVLNFTIKDFKQDDTGLKYSGSARQQIGDGGFIMQITDTATQKVVAIAGSNQILPRTAAATTTTAARRS